MFQVFENDKPADCFHRNVHKSWNNSKFNTFEEAVKYAHQYGAPYTGTSGIIFQLGVPYDYSGYGDTLTIKEI